MSEQVNEMYESKLAVEVSAPECVKIAKELLDLDQRGLLSPHGVGGLARDVIRKLIDHIEQRLSQPSCSAAGRHEIHVLFDGPPGPQSGRFVECEDAAGCSINAGEWRQRADGLWELVIKASIQGLSQQSDNQGGV